MVSVRGRVRCLPIYMLVSGSKDLIQRWYRIPWDIDVDTSTSYNVMYLKYNIRFEQNLTLICINQKLRKVQIVKVPSGCLEIFSGR